MSEYRVEITRISKFKLGTVEANSATIRFYAILYYSDYHGDLAGKNK